MATTAAFKAEVTATFHNGAVDFTTYVQGATEAEAIRTLEREGYDVRSIAPVKLTHLGGEVSA